MEVADSLSPWAVRLIDELRATDRRTDALARRLSPRQLNWKPTERSWSIGQCLQHLYAANEVYLPAIATSLDGQRPSPVSEITVGWFGRWFIRTYIDPASQRTRGRAPRQITPGELIDASIVDRFVQSNDEARRLVTPLAAGGASTTDARLSRRLNVLWCKSAMTNARVILSVVAAGAATLPAFSGLRLDPAAVLRKE